MHPAIKRASIVLVLVAIHSSPLFGQAQPKPSPPPESTEDSARWWTLTDEVTPQELHAIHEDVELHKERYQEAVRAGKQELLPKKQMDHLSFYIDGNSHPELFPMSWAFRTFAAGFEYDLVDPRVSLTEFGFKAEVVETIAGISLEYWRKREAISAKYEEDSEDLLEFVRLSRERLGEKGFRAAGKARDATRLAIATG